MSVSNHFKKAVRVWKMCTWLILWPVFKTYTIIHLWGVVGSRFHHARSFHPKCCVSIEVSRRQFLFLIMSFRHLVRLYQTMNVLYWYKLNMTLVIICPFWISLNSGQLWLKTCFTPQSWCGNTRLHSFPKCDILMFHNYKAIPSHGALFHQIAWAWAVRKAHNKLLWMSNWFWLRPPHPF